MLERNYACACRQRERERKSCNARSSCHRTLSLLMFTHDLHMSVCPINSWHTASSIASLHIPSQTHTGMRKFHGTECLHDHQLPYQNSQLCQDTFILHPRVRPQTTLFAPRPSLIAKRSLVVLLTRGKTFLFYTAHFFQFRIVTIIVQ